MAAEGEYTRATIGCEAHHPFWAWRWAGLGSNYREVAGAKVGKNTRGQKSARESQEGNLSAAGLFSISPKIPLLRWRSRSGRH